MIIFKGYSLVPKFSFRDVTDVSPDFLKKLGIKFLLLDLDNTIAAYDESTLANHIAQWAEEMKDNGIELFIVSNSLRKKRVEAFAESLVVGFVMRARKPSPKCLLTAIDTSGFSASETALIGDQVFTDTLAANRAGIISIIVRPRRFTNLFLALRYLLEVPLRAMCRNKMLKEVWV
jgi:hypothetical protein